MTLLTATQKRLCKESGHLPTEHTTASNSVGKNLSKCRRCGLPFCIEDDQKRIEIKYGPTLTFDEAVEAVKPVPSPYRQGLYWGSVLIFIVLAMYFIPTPVAQAATSIIEATDHAHITRDGNDLGTGTNWTTQYVNWDGVSTGGGGLSNNGSTFIFKVGSYPTEFQLGRAFVKFPAESDIPDGSTINGIDMCFTVKDKFDNYSDANDQFNVYAATPTSDTLIYTDVNNIGSTAFSTEIDVDTITDETEFCFTLNSDGLTYADLTTAHWFVIRGDGDYNNVAPTNDSTTFNVGFYPSDDATNPPRLVVDYTAPASSSSSSVASSSSSINTGTGGLTNTGSLIIGSSACDTFTGSGSYQICTEWSHSIQVQAVRFLVDSINLALLAVAAFAIVIFIGYGWLLIVIRWFWYLFTQRKR